MFLRCQELQHRLQEQLGWQPTEFSKDIQLLRAPKHAANRWLAPILCGIQLCLVDLELLNHVDLGDIVASSS